MPILTYHTPAGASAGLLNSRVLIGRKLPYGISLGDASVSRLHAWIDPVADEQADWVVTDAGSKSGTFVNDQPITRHHLHDGDVIRVGNVSLVYQELEQLPEGVASVEMLAPPSAVRGDGILFECTCGAPLWVDAKLAGKRGMCRHCRQPVTVPSLEEDNKKPPMPSAEQPPAAPIAVAEFPAQPTPQPAAEPLGSPLAQENAAPVPSIKPATSKKKNTCAVCHSAIVAGEEMTTCPDCAMSFHAECWQENFGCSSYGCPQVNCLQPKTEQVPATETAVTAADDETPQTNWELILFAASIVGSILGALMFGGLAALIALMSLVLLILKKPNRPVLLVAAIAVCIIGIAGGLVVSDIWWLNARHLPPALARHLHL